MSDEQGALPEDTLTDAAGGSVETRFHEAAVQRRWKRLQQEQAASHDPEATPAG
jgi:hypothetical protein